VEGVVFVPSPIRVDLHGQPHGAIAGWLSVYTTINSSVSLSLEGTVLLDGKSEVQPDAYLWQPAPGGPRLTSDHYLEGAPQFVVEVAASSASYDLNEKKEAYRRNGVREYVVWRVLDRAIDWFELRDETYVLRIPDEQGIIESAHFPGLRLSVPSMLAGDQTGVLAALRPSSAT
jgi:Uma2 family endonuclease